VEADVTLYVLAGLALVVCAAALWLYRRGRDAERRRAAERALKGATEARRIDNEVDSLDPDALRDDARKRVRRPGK
jgi:hypothetical protein